MKKVLFGTLVILINLLFINSPLLGQSNLEGQELAILDNQNGRNYEISYSTISNVEQEISPTNAVAPEKFYAVFRFHKIQPGKYDEYQKSIEAIKKSLQMVKEKGEIRSWTLYKRTFPSGTDVEYDYITSTTFSSGEQLEAYEKRPGSELMKGLMPDDAARVANFSDVVKIIKREIYEFQTSIPDGKRGKYLRINGIKVNPGKNKDYEKMIESSIPIVSEAMKSGKMNNRSSFMRCFPLGANLNDYTIVTEYENLTAALNSASTDLRAEFKKVSPSLDYDAEMKKYNEMRSILFSELLERIMGTE